MILSSCTGKTKQLEPTAVSQDVTPTIQVEKSNIDKSRSQTIGPENFDIGINPLTGKLINDPHLLDRRPMAVKISNDPRPMRPQWGLSLADIVYEYYTEWGKTRFIAVFLGNDAELAGPIRSARFFDENIIRMYKSVLAYVGADDRVLKKFYKADFADRLISEWPAGCPPICRIDPKMWNHAITNTAWLSQHVSKLGISNTPQDLRGMAFNESPPGGGEKGTSLSLRFSPYYYSQWNYDFSHQNYIRLEDSQDDDKDQGELFDVLNDRLTGEVISADNVVVLYANYQYIVKKEDAEVVNIDILGEGDALCFRNGFVYKLKWIRKTKETLLTLLDADGNYFLFKPGQTWFEVVGTSSSTMVGKHGIFSIIFNIP